MKTAILCAAVFFSIGLFCFSFAQDQNGDQNEKMKLWKDYMTPSTMHEKMASAVGKWKTHTKMWMYPSQPPSEMDGAAEFEMILGGRYLKSTETGMMMNMPFEGMLLEGYDNAKKEFTDIWVDNFGTGTMIMKGTYDSVKNAISLTGSSYDPMSGKDLDYHQLVSMTDSNNMHMELYVVKDGSETKFLEVDYTKE